MIFCKAYRMGNLRLQRIDESLIAAHTYLEQSDLCFFLGEYASGCRFQHSEINNELKY